MKRYKLYAGFLMLILAVHQLPAQTVAGEKAGIPPVPSGSQTEPWEDPQVVSINREAMRATSYSFENVEDALSCDRSRSSRVLMLKHLHEMKEADFVTLNIDLIQMGVGGNDSWSDVAAPLEKYRIKPGNYAYRFYLCPVKVGLEQVSKSWEHLKL